MKARQALLAAFLAGGAAAAEPPAAVDVEFLEFLGSLDTEDEEWRDYLAERPVRPEAGKPAGNPPDRSEDRKPADAGNEQQDKVKQP